MTSFCYTLQGHEVRCTHLFCRRVCTGRPPLRWVRFFWCWRFPIYWNLLVIFSSCQVIPVDLFTWVSKTIPSSLVRAKPILNEVEELF